MNLYTNFIELLDSLYANKLRSTLTILGIVIGVAAVIAMLSIGKGAQQSITNQIESIGTNLVYVSPGSVRLERRTRSPRIGQHADAGGRDGDCGTIQHHYSSTRSGRPGAGGVHGK